MSIADKGLLVNITLSVWSGRKLDKQVSEEVDVAKSTRARAGNYNKNLFAGVDELDAVRRISGEIRNWHHTQTLPWSDGGDRLLTMRNFKDYKDGLLQRQQDFAAAVAAFCDRYPHLISAQAFTMGRLFNRDEYPDAKDIAAKFDMQYTFSPVADVADWRVTADDDIRNELDSQYRKVYDDRLTSVTQELWDRLHTCLQHMNERLTVSQGGEKKIFRDSLLDNAVELCGLLTKLNITNDPKLEEARKALESAVCNVDIKDLRKDVGARIEITTQVNDILSRFEF